MVQQIKLYLAATPFRPFEIHCSSGDVFRVDHPENATIWRNLTLLALPDGDNAIVLSPLHITGVKGDDLLAA
jgi:hypothetical protein